MLVELALDGFHVCQKDVSLLVPALDGGGIFSGDANGLLFFELELSYVD